MLPLTTQTMWLTYGDWVVNYNFVRKSLAVNFNSTYTFPKPEEPSFGKWLQQKGFEPDNKIWVLPFSELLIIIPQGPKKK